MLWMLDIYKLPNISHILTDIGVKSALCQNNPPNNVSSW